MKYFTSLIYYSLLNSFTPGSERRIRTLVNFNEMQFGFMPGKEKVDAIFIVRRMQEEYQKKDKKSYMCFVDMEKAFEYQER